MTSELKESIDEGLSETADHMLVLADDLVNSLHLTQKLLKEEQQQHISIKNKYADAQSDLFTLRNDLAQVRLQLTTTTEAFKQSQEDHAEALKRMQEDHAEALKRMQEDHAEALKRMQEDRAEAKNGFEKLQSRLAEEQNAHKLTQYELHQNKQIIHELQDQLNSLKSEFNRSKLNANVAKYACVVLPIIVGLFLMKK